MMVWRLCEIMMFQQMFVAAIETSRIDQNNSSIETLIL